jgi:hypothetical protein
VQTVSKCNTIRNVQMRESMKEKAEQIILGFTAVFSILVSVLDLFGLDLLPSGIVFSLTLLGVGLITGYLVFRKKK